MFCIVLLCLVVQPLLSTFSSISVISQCLLRCGDVPTSDRLPYQATAGFDKKSSNRRKHSSHPSGLSRKHTKNTLATMAEWDLSQKIIPYLDRHLAFPLLAYLTETGLFPAEDVQAAQYELARKTNMVDFAVSLFESVYPGNEIPAGEFGSPTR